jgi:hypothetical protein
MSQFLRAFFLVVFALSGVSAKAEGKWHFREMLFEVRDPDGKPAPGVKVTLVGLERDAVRLWQLDQKPGEMDWDGNVKDWKFVTDSKGRFTARFGQFRAYDYKQATQESVPGWGGFYMIAKKEGTAGGVSPYLQNEGEDYETLPHLDVGRDDEWRKGEFAPVKLNASIDLLNPPVVLIQLKRGITVTGRVEDMAGKPIKGQRITVFNDLYSWSHTGRGCEIFYRNAETDSQGTYRIEHVYPNRFYMEANEEAIWIKTRVRGEQWQEKRVDEVMPDGKENEIHVDLALSDKAPYRYFGKITDEQGSPVVGADVRLSVSLHWPERTHEDTHSGVHAVSDESGDYSICTGSPFVSGFSIDAQGFKQEVQWRESSKKEEPFSPGPHNFRLKK